MLYGYSMMGMSSALSSSNASSANLNLDMLLLSTSTILMMRAVGVSAILVASSSILARGSYLEELYEFLILLIISQDSLFQSGAY